jgi:putative chitinase
MKSITVSEIIKQLTSFGIINKLEHAHFLGQADHESAGFTKLSEGTKYRFGRAKVIWPNRKSVIKAKQDELKASDNDFCPQPWLFNTVYGSRMGNEKNGTNDNDGYDYRGGGILQLTGTDNHLAFMNWLHKNGKYLSLTLDKVDEFVKSEEGAIISAIWFWQANGIGSAARADNITKVNIAINGGTIGLEERRELTEKYKKELGV